MEFKKVKISEDGRMATVAEVEANYDRIFQRVMNDPYTIALLDGGKVDGRSYGSKVTKGDFKEQCGEKIIVINEEDEGKGEPEYKAVRSDDGGELDIPDGWSVVGIMDPVMPTLMPRFMTGPQDAEDFNNGKMVIITNKPGAGPKEDWIIVEKENGEFQTPDDYKMVDMDESNFGEYMPKIQHLLNQAVGEKMNNGTIKFALKD